MAFVRTKTINNEQYAYLVNNKWTKKGSRQKSVQYLGKVFAPMPLQSDLTFASFNTLDMEKANALAIIRELVGFELAKHGFTRTKRNLFTLDGISVQLVQCVVTRKRGSRDYPCAVKLHEDYLTSAD